MTRTNVLGLLVCGLLIALGAGCEKQREILFGKEHISPASNPSVVKSGPDSANKKLKFWETVKPFGFYSACPQCGSTNIHVRFCAPDGFLTNTKDLGWVDDDDFPYLVKWCDCQFWWRENVRPGTD